MSVKISYDSGFLNGDIVRISDFSYAVCVDSTGALRMMHNQIPNACGEFRVVVSSPHMPTDEAHHGGHGRNDVMVQSIPDPRMYVFVRSAFLRAVEPPHTISIDGGDPIELTDEQWSKIRAQVTA